MWTGLKYSPACRSTYSSDGRLPPQLCVYHRFAYSRARVQFMTLTYHHTRDCRIYNLPKITEFYHRDIPLLQTTNSCLKVSRHWEPEIARHASRWMPPNWRTPYFCISTFVVFLSRILDHRILRSGSASACRFPRHRLIVSRVDFYFMLHCVITIHQRYA